MPIQSLGESCSVATWGDLSGRNPVSRSNLNDYFFKSLDSEEAEAMIGNRARGSERSAMSLSMASAGGPRHGPATTAARGCVLWPPLPAVCNNSLGRDEILGPCAPLRPI